MIREVVALCRHEPPYRKLWEESWQRHGWFVRVVGESECRAHPQFLEVEKLVDTLPTVNGSDFDKWCWLRWWGYGDKPICMVDLDTINYGFTPEMLVQWPQDKLIFLDDVDVAGNPIIIRDELLVQANYPNPIQHADKPHFSDMVALQNVRTRHTTTALAKQPLDCGWEDAKLVHFQNDRCRQLGFSRIDTIKMVNQLHNV